MEIGEIIELDNRKYKIENIIFFNPPREFELVLSIIDGAKMANKEILALKTQDGVTIKNYFIMLLETLWTEYEGFSGKRPFGNSGWEYDLYIPLAKAGVINGKFDKDGRLLEIDKEKGHKVVLELINSI